MARLAAMAKGGFYPVPIEVLESTLERISPPPNGERFYVCDPCCGEAGALSKIVEFYGMPQKRAFGCELEPTRYTQSINQLPAPNIVGPANYLSLTVDDYSFSFMWLNPPFDDELGGGGRVELDFLRKATKSLVNQGIMAFVCPESVAMSWQVKQHFATLYDDVSMVRFPDEHRRFNEVVVIGVKIDELSVKQRYMQRDVDYILRERKYCMPKGYYPLKFTKTELTAEEIELLVQESPLNRFVTPKIVRSIPSPPMSLGKGHVALLLASGHLDGVVSPPGQNPHLVRGTAKKVEYIASIVDESDENKDKTVVTKSERITLVIRTLSVDGEIKTFADKPEDAKAEEKKPETEEAEGEDDESDE